MYRIPLCATKSQCEERGGAADGVSGCLVRSASGMSVVQQGLLNSMQVNERAQSPLFGNFNWAFPYLIFTP